MQPYTEPAISNDFLRCGCVVQSVAGFQCNTIFFRRFFARGFIGPYLFPGRSSEAATRALESYHHGRWSCWSNPPVKHMATYASVIEELRVHVVSKGFLDYLAEVRNRRMHASNGNPVSPSASHTLIFDQALTLALNEMEDDDFGFMDWGDGYAEAQALAHNQLMHATNGNMELPSPPPPPARPSAPLEVGELPPPPGTKPPATAAPAQVRALLDPTSVYGRFMDDLKQLSRYYDPTSQKAVSLGELLAALENQRRGRGKSEKIAPVPVEDTTLWYPPSSLNQESAKGVLSGVQTFDGRQLIRFPPLVNVADLLPQALVGSEDEEPVPSPAGFVINPVMPDVGAPARNWAVISYYPKYEFARPDETILQMLHNLESTSPITPELRRLQGDLASNLAGWFYGGGTPTGQVGRLTAVEDLAAELREQRTKFGSAYKPLNEAQYAALVERRWPLAVLEHDGAPVKLEGTIRQIARAYPPLTAIEEGADAGAVWRQGGAESRGLKRGETWYQDFLLVEQMMSDMVANATNLARFWERWEWATVTLMKNKADKYKRTDLEPPEGKLPKTRNIFVTHAFAHIPLQMLFRASGKKKITFADDPDCWMMLGWTPFLGGMDQFLSAMLEEKRPLVYADNMYVVGTHQGVKCLLSIDAVKAEGAILPEEMVAEMQRRIRFLEENTTVDANFKAYITHVAPRLVYGPRAIFGAYQLATHQLPSGAQGTAEFNSGKTVRTAHAWDTLAGGKFDTGPNFQKAQEVTGQKLMVELATPVSEYLDLGFRPVRVDALGFDAIPLHEFGVEAWAPILNYERLLTALQHPSSAGRSKDPPILRDAITLARYRMLYLVGGYAYLGLGDLLAQRCLQILQIRKEWLGKSIAENQVERMEEMVNEIIGEGLTIDRGEKDVTVRNIINALTLRAVPTLYECMELGVGADAAQGFIRFINSHPRLREVGFNLVPARLHDQLEVKPAVVVKGVVQPGQGFRLETSPVADILRRVPVPSRPWSEVLESAEEVQPFRAKRDRPQGNRARDVGAGAFKSAERWTKLDDEAKKSAIDFAANRLAPLIGKRNPRLVIWERSEGDQSDIIQIFARNVAGVLGVPQPAAYLATRSLAIQVVDVSDTDEEESEKENFLEQLKAIMGRMSQTK